MPPAERAGGTARVVRLDPSVEAFPASDGRIYLLTAGGEDLVVDEPDATDRALLARLAAPTTVDDLVAELAAPRAIVEQKLLDLADAGLLCEGARDDGLSAEDSERFARQLPYFAMTGDAGAQQARLRSTTALVLGCGGLGTWVLGSLAAAGVGRFVLVDDDVVELSNLNRQILYSRADLGRRKVECADEWVRRFDPSIEVEPVALRVRSQRDVAALLDGVDVLVEAADWPPYVLARWVNASCVEAGVPFIVAAQVPPVLKVGPTFVPGRSPCFECHESGMRREMPFYDELVEHRMASDVPGMTVGAASATAGSLVALEVVHLVTGSEPVATEGRAWILDMRSLEAHWEALPRDPNCPACGSVWRTSA